MIDRRWLQGRYKVVQNDTQFAVLAMNKEIGFLYCVPELWPEND